MDTFSNTLTFLGAGRMANALIKGFIQASFLTPDEITASSKSALSAQALATAYGIHAARSNEEAIQASPIVFLCTKPAQALETLAATASLLKGKLIISVAAGISTESLFTATGKQARIIRAMPNTAVRLRKGVTTLSAHPSATKEDMHLAKRLFAAVGTVYEIEEQQKDAATAVSGSGPAFALLFLEALFEGGVQEGLDPKLARSLAAQTLSAAAALILETEDSPKALRAEIASPKGTTEAGLIQLEKYQFVDVVKKAVHAATKRAQELANLKAAS